jgi:hypothetical protein
LFIWYSKEGYAEFDCQVTIYERVGVGGRIDEVSFECLFQNALREKFTQKGVVFYPFRGMGLPFTGRVEGEVDQVRITAKGQDNNGHRIEKIKEFSVKWEED